MKSGIGIAKKIGLLAFLCVLITAVTIGFVYYYKTNNILTDHALESLHEEVVQQGLYMESEFKTLWQDVQSLAGTPPIQGLIRTQGGKIDPLDGSTELLWKTRLIRIFSQRMFFKPEYTQIRYIGVSDGGREIIRTQRKDGKIVTILEKNLQSKGEHFYFKNTVQLKKNQVYLSKIELNRERGKIEEPYTPVLRASTPIFDSEGKVFGIVIINMDIRSMLKRLAENNYYLVNEEGDFLAHPDSRMTFGFDLGTRHRIQESFPKTVPYFKSTQTSTPFIEEKQEEDKLLLYFAKIFYDPSFPKRYLGLVKTVNHRVLTAEATTLRNEIIKITLGLIAISTLFAFMMAGILVRPLLQITRVAERFPHDDQDLSLPEKARDEVGILARSFRSMIQTVREKNKALVQARDELELRVQERTEELHESREKIHSIMTHAPGAIITINQHGIIDSFNPEAEKVFGYTEGEVIGRNVSLIMPSPHSQLHDDYLQKYLDTGKANVIGFTRELEGLKKDGTRIPIEISVSEVILKGKSFFTGIIQDISIRKNEQKILEQYRINLERSNRDLEQFAYAASHDLQEPLRMISSFTYLLRDRHKDKLEDEAEEFMDFILDGTNRMKELIMGLLMYSRLSHSETKAEKVDCLSLVDKVCQNLKVLIEENQARIIFTSLPVITADPSQLNQLFQNLIGNAIKFHGENLPIINVSAEEKGDRWVFSVTDNGIGFDMEFADRIFTIFQRLNNRAHFSGTGIGLSICKKIVEWHNGEIWVESEPGKGSAFYFSIPKAQPAYK